MDDVETDPWSAIASQWQRRWGRFASPAWPEMIEAGGVGAGDRVLDVGCGSGELIAHLDGLGMRASGVDTSAAMVALAQSAAPSGDIRLGEAEALPWADGIFDLTMAVNALHLTDDTGRSLEEMLRVTRDGGHVAMAGWAGQSLNDLDIVHVALAREDGDDPGSDDDLRRAGGLESLLADAGLTDVHGGLVEVPWEAADADALVRGVLLGEDEPVIASYAPVVIAAARPFRLDDGSYRFVNHLRWAVGCTTARSR